MSMSLIIMEGKYSGIGADDSSFNGYYVIKFASYTYTLQSDLSIDGEVISSSEMVREGSYLLPININSSY